MSPVDLTFALPSKPLRVRFHPPRQARSVDAVLTVEHGPVLKLTVSSEEDSHYTREAVKVVPPLGKTERIIRFADGAQCRVEPGQEALFAVVEAQFTRDRMQSCVHRLEGSLKWIAVAALVTLAVIWGAYTFGLPAVAKHLAEQSSPTIRSYVSKQSMELIDDHFMSPSGLSSDDRALLQRLTEEVDATLPDGFDLQLAVRSSKVGPNAFALPDGTIVFTDELYRLLENEDQIIAVIAHEAGHVEKQHGMRLVIQNTGVAIAVSLVLGDVSSWGGIASALPTVLAQSAYSREFETEADLHAAAFLATKDLDVTPMREALMLLHKEAGEFPAEDIISSHPSLKARLESLDAFASHR